MDLWKVTERPTTVFNLLLDSLHCQLFTRLFYTIAITDVCFSLYKPMRIQFPSQETLGWLEIRHCQHAFSSKAAALGGGVPKHAHDAKLPMGVGREADALADGDDDGHDSVPILVAEAMRAACAIPSDVHAAVVPK